MWRITGFEKNTSYLQTDIKAGNVKHFFFGPSKDLRARIVVVVVVDVKRQLSANTRNEKA
jgi:hypothetical protein